MKFKQMYLVTTKDLTRLSKEQKEENKRKIGE